ncbi:MAG: hypothetical protein GWP14_10055 [Actinobacteria bacterium]|nr:hypothetical protein [Actinomycetota bacterium]
MKLEKRILPALLAVALAMLSSAVGCSPQRGTTVDPLPQPIFRENTKPNTNIGTGRVSRTRTTTGRGPWTVANLSNRWKYIIIHHSATAEGGAKRFDIAHRNNGWDELGYHFVIGNGSDTRDGKIEVGPRWYEQKHGAHCRVPGDTTNKYNKHGIGICLVGNFDYKPPSRKQMQALIRLTKGLLKETRLPVSAVHFHRDFKGTDCPGRYFPYEEFKRALRN